MKLTLPTMLIMTVVIIFGFVNSVNAATSSTAQVYSTTTNLLKTTSGFEVGTITKGLNAANDPIYKSVVQSISKPTFKTALKGSLLAAKTPYTIAFYLALEAYDVYYDEETGQIVRHSDSGNLADMGNCHLNYSYSNVTLQECYLKAAAYVNKPTTSFYLTPWPASYPNYFYVTYDGSGNILRTGNWVLITPSDSQLIKTPLTEDEIYTFWESYYDSNPDIDHSQLLTNSSGLINLDYFPDSSFDYVTATDAELLDLYNSGLLQSSDPAQPNYVTAEELARIQALNSEVNPTIEEQIDYLNNKIEQPITQEQYAEEQLSKEERLATSQATESESVNNIDLSSLDRGDDLDEQFNILDNLIQNPTDLPSVLPTMPQLGYTSSCLTVTLPFDIEFPNPTQCSRLNEAKTMTGYFLYVLFFWIIINTLLKESH